MYYVYVIKSIKEGWFYTGITNNIDRRIKEHDQGKISTKTTYNKGPFELIHVELVEDRISARELEKFFKSGFGREVRDEIVSIR